MTIRGLPSPSPARPWHFPPVEERTLSNGLRALVCALPGQPLICLSLVIQLPIQAEPEGLDGITDVLAAAFRIDLLADVVDRRLGTGLAVTAEPQGIRLRMMCRPATVREAITLFSAVVRHPRLDEDRVGRLVRGRVNARRRTSGDQGGTEADALRAALFGGDHRLGRPWLGTPSALENIGAAELREFHESRVRPDRIAIVVTGDPAAIVHDDHIAAEFGEWTGKSAAKAVSPHTVGAASGRLVLVERPEYEQVHSVFGAIVPGPGDPQWPALLSALYLLGGAQLALLDLVLREQHGYTFGIRASTDLFPGGAVAVIQGFIAADHAPMAYARLLAILDRLGASGCTQDELDHATRSLRDAAPRHLQTSKEMGTALAETAIRGLSHRYPAWLHGALADVTTEDIRDAIAAHLAAERLVSVVAGPRSDITRVRG